MSDIRALVRMEAWEREWSRRPPSSLMMRSCIDHGLKKEILEDLFEIYPIQEFSGENVWYDSLREAGNTFVRRPRTAVRGAVRRYNRNDQLLGILRSSYLQQKMHQYAPNLTQAKGYSVGLHDFLSVSNTDANACKNVKSKEAQSHNACNETPTFKFSTRPQTSTYHTRRKTKETNTHANVLVSKETDTGKNAIEVKEINTCNTVSHAKGVNTPRPACKIKGVNTCNMGTERKGVNTPRRSTKSKGINTCNLGSNGNRCNNIPSEQALRKCTDNEAGSLGYRVWVDNGYLHIRNLGLTYFEWTCPGEPGTFCTELLPGKSGLVRLTQSWQSIQIIESPFLLTITLTME